MTKYQPGNLVYINDDKKENGCIKILSDDFLDADPIVLLLDQNYLKTKEFRRASPGLKQLMIGPFSKSHNEPYEICMLRLTNGPGKDQTKIREPELPKIGMFLARVRITFGLNRKIYRMPLILGGEQKFLVPFHFLAPALPEKESNQNSKLVQP